MDRSAQPALDTYLQNRRQLISLACSIVESQSVAEELVQESWLRWSQKNYPEKDARPILRRIVSNLAFDWGRRRSRELSAINDRALEPHLAPSSEHVVMARQDLIAVIHVLQALPKRSVSAFRMHIFGGKTYAEIGRKLGISRSRAYELVEDTLVRLALSLDD